MWYSRSMSRRALQEDCQMFSLLTLVAFGIIGTLLVGIQYYFLQGRSWGLGRLWTKSWLLFSLFTTLVVYFINIYMIVRSQLAPWYRWWQSARDIKLILENRKPLHFRPSRRLQNCQTTTDAGSLTSTTSIASQAQAQNQHDQPPQNLQQAQQQQQQPDGRYLPAKGPDSGIKTTSFAHNPATPFKYGRAAMTPAAEAAEALEVEFGSWNCGRSKYGHKNNKSLQNPNRKLNIRNDINNKNNNNNRSMPSILSPIILAVSSAGDTEKAMPATVGDAEMEATFDTKSVPMDSVVYEFAAIF